MNILLIGSGGREHAIAWKLLQSKKLAHLYLTSPNATVEILQQEFAEEKFPGRVTRCPLKETEHQALIDFVKQHDIQLVIMGNEAPLAAGLSDLLRANNIAVFGPSKAAAEIESSKVFSKEFMQRHGISTARFKAFTDFKLAQHYLNTSDYPIVIKASGLAAGKGVYLPDTKTEAESILRDLLVAKSLGDAGNEIVIEERLTGPEVSLLCFTDGKTVSPMPPARDHKRLKTGDIGPNTGGMGVFAPVKLTPTLTLPREYTREGTDPEHAAIDYITKSILQPTIDGMRAEGKPFVGVLYAGLMLTPDGPKVLEYNCRFGDPETQVLLPLLKSDLLEIILACVEGLLKDYTIEWMDQAAVCVVLASKHYPEKSSSGDIITLPKKTKHNTHVFHAGTRWDNNIISTAGGRILGITALGKNLEEARKMAYDDIKDIKFDGMQHRTDIGTSATNDSSLDAYAQAGVDINAGNRTIELMKNAVKSTYGKEVLAGIGAFGGMYDANFMKDMKHPVLVASTDGVGTKVELGVKAERFKSLGYDIVNHSINDILVQGARPLFFFDYVAVSKLDPQQVAEAVTGMAEACKAVGCALLGGETAEMPGVYAPNMFDIAGTIVGVVEKDQALPRNDIQVGDVLLGIGSSGPHTNGYSLVRKIFAEDALDVVLPELGIPLVDALLAPHRNYLPILTKALHDAKHPIKGLVHITGGGFYENIPRFLPDGINAEISKDSWPVPALFQLIQKRGEIPFEQMHRIFNMGVGMIIITAPENVELVKKLVAEPVWQIGHLTKGNREVVFK
jgi:phosphoribosylamine--glycine ligase/phosphoribosylformylglycinamidine cyclo-ligase